MGNQSIKLAVFYYITACDQFALGTDSPGLFSGLMTELYIQVLVAYPLFNYPVISPHLFVKLRQQSLLKLFFQPITDILQVAFGNDRYSNVLTTADCTGVYYMNIIKLPLDNPDAAQGNIALTPFFKGLNLNLGLAGLHPNGYFHQK